MTGWMEGATGVQAANFLMKMEGEGLIEAVAVMTTGTNTQEEAGGMITVGMIETITVIVMIIVETTIAEVVETVTDAATEIAVGAVIPEAGAVAVV